MARLGAAVPTIGEARFALIVYSIACWGRNDYGQSTPPAATFTQVSTGYDYTCGVKTDGSIACWGLNDNGQSTPPAATFTQVSTGYDYTCGLTPAGHEWCWGKLARQPL